MDSLPIELLTLMDLEKIHKEAEKRRKKQLHKLKTYLDAFEVPEVLVLSMQVEEEESSVEGIQLNTLEKGALHKYRLYIKKKLYREKTEHLEMK